MKSFYENKCVLKGYNIDNYDMKSLHKKKILAIMENDYVDISYVYCYDDVNFVMPFDKDTFDSYCYLMETTNLDKNHPVYSKIDLFNEAIKQDSIDPYFDRKNNIKVMQYFKFFIPLDEIDIVKNIDDTCKFKVNVLNLFDYNSQCTHYTNSQVIYLNNKDELSVGSLLNYNTYEKEWSLMKLSDFTDIDDAKYINFLYNIKFELK